MKNVLIVAAHADDECLGAAGAIAKHVENGDNVLCVILCPDRHEMAVNAANVIGHKVEVFYLSDQEFDTYSLLSITQMIERVVSDFRPNIVYTHWIGDLNKDHEITARATLTACRPLPGSTIEAIYGFEIPSSTEWGMHPFVPTHFEVLNERHAEKKALAIDCYGGEIKEFPHARSLPCIGAMAVKGGGEIGKNLAERFHTYRSINK